MRNIRKGAFDALPGLARRVAWKRSLARSVLFVERLMPRLLPMLGVAALFLAFAWFGLFRLMPDMVRWALLIAFGVGFAATLLPIARLRWPASADADRLLEARNHLPHQPVAVQDDALSHDTPSARALWKEHQIRMAERIAALDAGLPQPDIARHDRHALRAVPPSCWSPHSASPSLTEQERSGTPFGQPLRQPTLLPTCGSMRG